MAVLLAGASLACVKAVAQAPAASPGAAVLPAGEGRDTMIRVCSGCHSPDLVANKRLDSQGWYDLVQFMADRGAVASDADMATIVSYLAKSFPKDAPAAGAAATPAASTAAAK